MSTWCEWLNDGDCVVNEDVYLNLIAMREWLEKNHKDIYDEWLNRPHSPMDKTHGF